MAISQINSNSLASGVPASSNMPTGSVLQVVQSTYATVSTVSGGPSDTGLTVNITPKFNTSKILVMFNLPIYSATGSGDVYMRFYIVRSGTTINSTNYAGVGLTSTAAYQSFAYTYLDPPATTSALTYKIQVTGYSSANEIFSANTMGTITVMEIAA